MHAITWYLWACLGDVFQDSGVLPFPKPKPGVLPFPKPKPKSKVWGGLSFLTTAVPKKADGTERVRQQDFTASFGKMQAIDSLPLMPSTGNCL